MRTAEFVDLTLLTIAHRLQTVIDYDQLLVMGGGRLLESGAPLELLQKEGSTLGEMAAALGEVAAEDLTQRATAAAELKKAAGRPT